MWMMTETTFVIKVQYAEIYWLLYIVGKSTSNGGQPEEKQVQKVGVTFCFFYFANCLLNLVWGCKQNFQLHWKTECENPFILFSYNLCTGNQLYSLQV